MIPVWVIMPALNEERSIGTLLTVLQAMPGIERIVVCDGGSTDTTREIAAQYGADVVMTERNRGLQMNAGVAALLSEGVSGCETKAEVILWFLHADARPHRRSAALMAATVQSGRVMGGNFRLRFNDRGAPARIFEIIARLQRRFGVYYGDSGLFVRSDVFELLGGFRDWPLFEDYDFVRRLEYFVESHGGCTTCLPLPITASARRFQRHPWRTLGIWLVFQILYWFGVKPERLATMYHR